MIARRVPTSAVPAATTPSDRPRVGAVGYLNSKPLVEGLADQLPGGLALDYPSRLAVALRSGDLDVALVPSVEALRSEDDYEIVSDACVAARGPVRSVKAYFRVPPGEVRTLALDEGSRTSATLVRVLLHHKYGVEPATEPLSLELSPGESAADAVLLIGDRAMFPVDEKFVAVWDLGEEWLNWTGLPFVFAVWAGRREGLPSGLADVLSETRDRGVASVETIARREAATLGLDPALALDYLRHNLHFTLGPAERSGLKLFRQLARQAGLIPGGIDLVDRDRDRTTDDRVRADAAHRPPAPRRESLVAAR